MKQASPPPISAHRLERFCKLARLYLLRVAGWIFAIAGLYAPIERRVGAIARPFLDKLTRIVLTLIVLKACAQLAPAKFRKAGAPLRARRHLDRTLFGSRLRRLLRARDLRARIAMLLNVLNDICVHAARLAKRLAHGLTRRLGGFRREAGAAAPFTIALIAPVAVNTS